MSKAAPPPDASSPPGEEPTAQDPTTKGPIKRAFIAGATGFTGRALALQPREGAGVELALQVRPGSSSLAKLDGDERVVQVATSDGQALAAAMEGMDAVVQLIGTVRANFNDETSYESVDYGTTIALLDAARRAGVEHFVLLSSVGAGLGFGEYLRWKKKTERAVTSSGLGYTILRPSYLAGDDEMTERRPARFTSAFLGGMSDSPVGYPFAAVRPINIQVLAQIILEVIRQGPRNNVLMGHGLFQIARRLGLHAQSVVSQLS